MKTVYLVIGCPGSGKSWVCEKLAHLFEYVHHDGFIGHINQPLAYVSEIKRASRSADKPILAEAPFSISQIKDPLEAQGFKVIPVFIQEDPEVIADRYYAREGKQIPKGHLTRQETYAQRAREWGSFQGTSSEVLNHLTGVATRGEL